MGNRFLAGLTFIVSMLAASVACAENFEGPKWAAIASEWTPEQISLERVLFRYKTGRAFMLVERTPVDLDRNGVANYLKNDFKKESEESRRSLIATLSKEPSSFEYSVKKDSEIETALLVSRYSAFEKETVLAETLWVDRGMLWHIVFVEASAQALSEDTYVKGIELLKTSILKATAGEKSSAKKGISKSVFEVIFGIEGLAYATTELAPTRAVSRSSGAPSSQPSKYCTELGLDETRMRKGAAGFDFDLRLAKKSCADDFRKLTDAMKSGVVDAIRSFGQVEAPEDIPECRHLKPQAKPVLASGAKLRFDNQGFDQFNKWRSCVTEFKLKRGTSRLLAGAVDANSYSNGYEAVKAKTKRAFDETVRLASQGSLLASPMGQQQIAAILFNYAGTEINAFKCLNKEAQYEGMCAAAAGAVSVLAAAGCTYVTRFKCLSTLKSQFASIIDDVLRRFKKLNPSRAHILAAEAKSLQQAERLERIGLAKIRRGLDCRKINGLYKDSFPESPKGCTAIKAEKDIDTEFCGCGDISKRRFNFLFYCPTTQGQFRSVAKFSSDFTLPNGTNLDMCARVKIPKGKECYTGSTAQAFTDTLSGRGGAVQVFCVNGISPAQAAKGVDEATLARNGLTSSKPDLHVTANRWSPFSEFSEFQSVIDKASRLCPETCDQAVAKQLTSEFEAGRAQLRRSLSGRPDRLKRLEIEERSFNVFLRDLQTGRRHGLPQIN